MRDPSVGVAELDVWLMKKAKVSIVLKPNGLPDHSKAYLGSIARMTRMMIQREGRGRLTELYSQLAQKSLAAKQLIQVKE